LSCVENHRWEQSIQTGVVGSGRVNVCIATQEVLTTAQKKSRKKAQYKYGYFIFHC
jgi:hypothetical protein